MGTDWQGLEDDELRYWKDREGRNVSTMENLDLTAADSRERAGSMVLWESWCFVCDEKDLELV